MNTLLVCNILACNNKKRLLIKRSVINMLNINNKHKCINRIVFCIVILVGLVFCNYKVVAKKIPVYYMLKGEVTDIPVEFYNGDYFYKSDNHKVLQFTEKGKMKALKSGNATVILTHFDINNKPIRKKIKVKVQDKVRGLKLINKVKTINLGEEYDYELGYKVKSKRNIVFRWDSSNPEIASVDQNGKVTALGVGTAKIKCSVEGQKKASVSTKIKVVTVPVKELRIDNNDLTLKLNSYYNINERVSVYPENATNKLLETTSQNENVVKVEYGVLYAVGKGQTTVTVEAADGSGCRQVVNVVVDDWIDRDDVRFVAHRGLSSEATENSLKAFDLAGVKGFYETECDIWLSKDGQFVVSHDSNLYRMCGVNIEIKDITYDEICKIPIKAGSNYQNYANDKMSTTVPTLKQFLYICKIYNMVPMIEVKFSEGNSELINSNVLFRLYNEINEMMGDKSVSVISFNQSVIKNMNEIIKKEQAKNIKLFLLGGNYKSVSDISDYRFYIENNIGFSIEHHIDENVIRKMVADGAEVCLWTVDETDNVKTYIDWGVTYIVTNKVLWKQ